MSETISEISPPPQLLKPRPSRWLDMRTTVANTARVIILLACGLMSAYIGASAYESFFNKTLPIVHTVDTVKLTSFTRTYNLPAFLHATSVYGSYGRPVNFKIPKTNTRLDIIPAPDPVSADTWLARTNTVQIIPLSDQRNNTAGLLLLYMRLSFRTIDQPDTLRPGDNVFIDTDKNWRYIYRVDTIRTIGQNDNYVISDNGSTGKVVIDAYDKQTQSNLIIEATLLQVVGIDQ